MKDDRDKREQDPTQDDIEGCFGLIALLVIGLITCIALFCSMG